MRKVEGQEIPYPDEERRKKEISEIVSRAAIAKEPFSSVLLGMYRQIGWRFLLRDYKEVSFAVVLMGILMFAIWNAGMESAEQAKELYSWLMLYSPLLYGVIVFLPFINSRTNRTEEVEMACKYNLYQVAAFRMLAFSVFCFVMNTVWVAGISISISGFVFVQAWLISTASLFIFAIILLYALRTFRQLWQKLGVIVGWMALHLLLGGFDSIAYHQLLVSVPWYLYSLVIGLSAWRFILQIKKLMLVHKTRGAFINVDG